MVQILFDKRQVICKIVYYGPGLSGKTTNLEVVHNKAPEKARGDLTSIATRGDRTLYFDYMPLEVGHVQGMKTTFQLYTVPGQIYYNNTRKLVLQGVDGVVFVADSNPAKMPENVESLNNLRDNLAAMEVAYNDLPLVMQYNKRDLSNAVAVSDMNAALNSRGVPFHEAIAKDGQGVFATLKSIGLLVIDNVDKQQQAPEVLRQRATTTTVSPPPGVQQEAPRAVPAPPPPAGAGMTGGSMTGAAMTGAGMTGAGMIGAGKAGAGAGAGPVRTAPPVASGHAPPAPAPAPAPPREPPPPTRPATRQASKPAAQPKPAQARRAPPSGGAVKRAAGVPAGREAQTPSRPKADARSAAPRRSRAGRRPRREAEPDEPDHEEAVQETGKKQGGFSVLRILLILLLLLIIGLIGLYLTAVFHPPLADLLHQRLPDPVRPYLPPPSSSQSEAQTPPPQPEAEESEESGNGNTEEVEPGTDDSSWRIAPPVAEAGVA